ncbi:hypothetical protein KP509_25G010600 [Ceratopteris richardii]|uniref:Outer dense fiber protein 3 n=1 Tax=Ceratopteris richardii TaxID=49495 RepID=A0A8T2RPN2_CERRI|nr:hypothetical protein KP509_25G010600 [Ceratopteris richardii]
MQSASKRRLKTPGPGAYNTNARPITPCPPAYSMGAKWGDLTGGLDWEPGPGSYEASVHRTRCRDGPSITIAPRIATTTTTLGLSKSDAPGPGSYNSQRCASLIRWREPAYSIASRTQNYHREISPGPGAYSVIFDTPGPAFSMTHTKKQPLLLSSDTPGPGAYTANEHLQRPRTPVISISGSGRESKNQIVAGTSPGPGAYNPLRSPKARAITISIRRPSRPIEESPGPGQYSAEAAEPLIHPREPALSIAGRTKDGLTIGVESFTPGPGAYDPKKWVPGSGTAITMLGRPAGRRRSAQVAEATPGPGAYFLTTPPSTSYPSPAIKIAGKYHRSPPTPVPGPGAYSPRMERDAHAVPMTSKRSTLFSSDPSGPGPANYFWDNKYYTNFRSPAISMGIRFSKRASASSPGPGHYNVPSVKLGPSFSMHSGSDRYTFA